MSRRRALIAQGDDRPVYLYQNGVSLPELGQLSILGFNSNTTYNKVDISGTFHYWATNTSANSGFKGARTATFANPISSKYIGRNLYIKGRRKNSGGTTTDPNDYAGCYISESVQDATSVAAAFTNRIGWLTNFTTTQSNLTEFTYSYAITQTGYLSFIGRKNGGGETEIYIDEVWIE